MTVQHDPQRQQFWLEPQPGLRGELDYALQAGVVNFHHTGVHPGLRGQGVAAQLVVAGLQWAQAQQLKVHGGCSYVAKYLDEHPEWAGLRA